MNTIRMNDPGIVHLAQAHMVFAMTKRWIQPVHREVTFPKLYFVKCYIAL